MSAFAVKVSSDKQTLILAGEATPPRVNTSRAVATRSVGMQLQRVTMLLVQREYPATVHALPAPAQSLMPYPSSPRVLAPGAAEYARTQNLSGDPASSRIIDTYA